MDSSSLAKLTFVHHKLADKIKTLNEMLWQETQGDSLVVVQALRTWQQQAKLYAQGRTSPGAIVTNAKPGHSWHEFGMAVDVCPESIMHETGWAPDSPLWLRIKQMGESLGLVSGACWQTPDKPHLQLTGKFGVSPDDTVRALFLQQGMIAVWDAAEIP